jgi:hypothetical protein
MPNNLKGNDSSQNIGYNTMARIARGQQRIKRMIQRRKVNIYGRYIST